MSLSTIEKILNRACKPADQKKVIEQSKDCSGKPFTMQRTISSKANYSYLLYRFDIPSIKDIFPVFENVSGIKKMCDYLLFVEENGTNTLFAFLIEMKQGSKTTTPQLEATECFVNYVAEIAKRLNMPFNHLEVRKIGIRGNNPKGTTRRNMHVYNKDSYLPYTNQKSFIINELMH